MTATVVGVLTVQPPNQSLHQTAAAMPVSRSSMSLSAAAAAELYRSAKMMDRRIQIWSILHDGEITAISGEGSDTFTMFVSIPYLRRRLEPLGDSFVLTLSGVTRLEFHGFDGTPTPLQEELDVGSPEILSTESESMPISIATTLGQLTLDFQSISFALDTGQAVEYEVIEKVCEEYWAEWKTKAEQAAAERRGKTRA